MPPFGFGLLCWMFRWPENGAYCVGGQGRGGPAPGGLFIRGDVSLILRLALISPEESFGEMTALWIFQKSPGCLARKVGRVVAYLP